MGISVAGVRDGTDAFNILIGNSEGKTPFGRQA